VVKPLVLRLVCVPFFFKCISIGFRWDFWVILTQFVQNRIKVAYPKLLEMGGFCSGTHNLFFLFRIFTAPRLQFYSIFLKSSCLSLFFLEFGQCSHIEQYLLGEEFGNHVCLGHSRAPYCQSPEKGGRQPKVEWIQVMVEQEDFAKVLLQI
jgi:hypothetical protein